MSPPRLVHVFSTFAPGGPQVRTARILAALGGAYAHAALPMDGRSEARELLPAGIGLELLPAPRKGSSVRAVAGLRRTLRAARPDLVLTYNWGAIEAVLAARTLGLPVLHHEDGFLPDEARAFKRRRELARRALLPGARAVVVPSATLRRIALERWRLAPEHVVHVPNGIDVGAFAPRDGNAALRAELGVPAGAFVVGGVGHLRGEKSPVRLVEALAAMEARDARLVVLGDGPERGAVEAAAARLGVAGRVVLAGHRAELAPWYRAMDALAIPSDTEQMPVALLEAMASALPVASTRVGDVPEVLPPAQAPFVVERDAAALARALDRLAADPALRAELGAANRARVAERYGFERMLATYRGLYDRALGPR